MSMSEEEKRERYYSTIKKFVRRGFDAGMAMEKIWGEQGRTITEEEKDRGFNYIWDEMMDNFNKAEQGE